MQSDILMNQAQFAIGECVSHQLMNYRGVIVDVDPQFQHNEKRLKELAKTLKNKDQPWYHVLVHGTNQVTYVAEPHLRHDSSEEEIEHPVVDLLFTRDEQGHYQRRLSLQ